jgi:hypothetical protein
MHISSSWLLLSLPACNLFFLQRCRSCDLHTLPVLLLLLL